MAHLASSGDRGLTARMTPVMFLLGGLFVALIVVLMGVAGNMFGSGAILIVGLVGLGIGWSTSGASSDTVAMQRDAAPAR